MDNQSLSRRFAAFLTDELADRILLEIQQRKLRGEYFYRIELTYDIRVMLTRRSSEDLEELWRIDNLKRIADYVDIVSFNTMYSKELGDDFEIVLRF